MTSHAPSIEGVVHLIQESVGRIEKNFRNPNDDWVGVCFLGRIGDSDIQMVPADFSDQEEKEAFATTILPLSVLFFQAEYVALLLSAWMVSVPVGEEMPERPSLHPDRVESLILSVITIEETQLWTAKINRFPDSPPKLDPWKLFDDEGKVEGMFVDPVRWALEKVRENDGDE